MTLPAILYVEDVKALIDNESWSTQKVRRFLRSNHLCENDAQGFVFTTPEVLEERMPLVYRAMCRKWEARKCAPVDLECFGDLDEDDAD